MTGNPGVDSATTLWWVRLPRRLSGIWPSMLAVLTDGADLTTWPVAGALVPPAALVTGLVIGTGGLGQDDIFTSSITVISIMLAVGTLSAAVGAWLVSGYILGDFLLRSRPAPFGGSGGDVLVTHAALLVCYSVLVTLVVLVPLTARWLAVEMLRLTHGVRVHWGRAVIESLLGGALALAWSQGAVVLTRPYFSWHGIGPTQNAVATLRDHGWVLAIVAVVAHLVRAIVESRVAAPNLALESPAPPRRRLQEPLATVARAGVTVLLLAGLMDGWTDALLVGAALIVLVVARDRGLPRLGALPHRVSRMRVLPRLVVGAVTSGVLAVLVVNVLGQSSSVHPVVVSTIVSLVVFALVLPDHVLEHAAAHAAGHGGHAHGGAVDTGATDPHATVHVARNQ